MISVNLEYGRLIKTQEIKFFDILKKVILKKLNIANSIVKLGNKKKIGLKPKSNPN